MKTHNRTLGIVVFLGFMCLISGCSTIGQGVGGLFSGVGYVVGGALKLVGKALDLVGHLPMPPPGVF